MKKVTLISSLSFVLMCAVFIFTLSLPVPAQGAGEKILKIGLITSMTGPMAPGFKSMVEAAKPTADLLNQRGGITIKGTKYNIEIITEDDQSSPPGAVAAMNKLMQDGVKFVLPPMFMVSDMAISPMAEQNKIIRMKALGAGKTQANPDLPYSFLASTGMYNIAPGYDYLKKYYPKVKRIAVITPDDPGGKTYQEVTRKEIEKHGYELVFWEAFKIGSEDFYPILTKALEKKPDAIDMIYAIIPWTAGIVNQSRELGFTGPIFGPALLGDINTLNAVFNPKYAHDIFHMGPDVQSAKMLPIVKDFRKLVEKSTKTPFNMDHCVVLEAAYDLVQAIQKAQSLDTDEVKKTLENMKSIDTIYGKGRMAGMDIFGINHVIRRPVMFSRIMNGKIEFEFTKAD
jgi:branched-chain amino acid transport system substrate-binding protein